MKKLAWQKTAQSATCKKLEDHDRVRLIAPTGCGKTALAVWLAKRMGSTLVTSVRSKILSQYFDAFNSIDPGRPIIVIASPNPHVKSTPPFETDKILDWLQKYGDHPRATILSMYQSSGPISSILASYNLSRKERWINLSIMDEAHCSTGLATPSPRHWKHVHELNKQYARKTVALTATERYIDDGIKVEEGYEIYSQHMLAQYGPVAYEMTFAEAVRKGYLSDYKIVGMFSSEKLTDRVMNKLDGSLKAKLPNFLREAAEHTPSVMKAWARFSRPVTPDEIFKAWCVLECMRKERKKRCLCFFNRINEAIRFNLILFIVSQFKDAPLRLDRDQIHALHAETSAKDEKLIYESFESTSHRPVIVSSVNKLSMGVDFPNADMAAFIDPRKGEISLPQSAGRVTRFKEGKRPVILIVGYLDDAGCLIEFNGSYAQSKQNACRMMLDVLHRLQKTDLRMTKVITALSDSRIGRKSIIVGGGSSPEVSITLPIGLRQSLKGMTIREATGEGVSFVDRLDEIYHAAHEAARAAGIDL